MKKRNLALFLAFLLIPALLLPGCERDTAATDPADITSPTATQNQTDPTETTVATDPTEATTEPETQPAEKDPVAQGPTSGYPYEIISLHEGKTLLLYDPGCNHDIYTSSLDGTFLYEVLILTKAPLEQSLVSMTAEGLSSYTCTLTDHAYDMVKELEGHPYLHASFLGLDPEQAIALYNTYAEADARYLESRRMDDYDTKNKAWDAYQAYLGEGKPEIPYHAYSLSLTGNRCWDLQGATIHNVELQLGDEHLTLPVGEIRAHGESVRGALLEEGEQTTTQTIYYSGSGYTSMTVLPGVYVYASEITDEEQPEGQYIWEAEFYATDDLILEKLELLGQTNAQILEINIHQEAGGDSNDTLWDGQTIFHVQPGDTVVLTVKLALNDPRMADNMMYHGAVYCALSYTATKEGKGVLPMELEIRPEPDYLALCSLHLDGVDVKLFETK